MNWDARDGRNDRKASYFGNSGAARQDERDTTRNNMFFDRTEQDVEHSGSFRTTRFSEVFAGRDTRTHEKREPSQAMLDRRAAFEQMLNPSAGVAGRMPGALEPVPSLSVPAVSAPGLAIPSIVPPKALVIPADPTVAFNEKHDRLRGRSLEDVNKKYTRPAPAAPQPGVETRFQTPLHRQPVTREFPSRRF
jgi:hypothetical protein